MISATERNSNEHRNVKYAKIRRLITKTKINTTKIFRASSTAKYKSNGKNISQSESKSKSFIISQS